MSQMDIRKGNDRSLPAERVFDAFDFGRYEAGLKILSLLQFLVVQPYRRHATVRICV